MNLRWDWIAGDYDEGLVLDPEQQQVSLWGEWRNWTGPRFAIPSGGRSLSFSEFLAEEGRSAPEAIRADVLATVRALLRTTTP